MSKRRSLHVLLTLCLGLLSVSCREMPAMHPLPAQVQQPNLLRNAGLKRDTLGWSLRPEQLPPALSAQRTEGGSLVLALDSGAGPTACAWTQLVEIAGGQSYAVSCRVRTQRLDGAANLRLEFHDRRGRLLAVAAGAPVCGDSDWTPLAWRGQAPEGASYAVFSVGLQGACGGEAAFIQPYLGLDDAPATRALVVSNEAPPGPLSPTEAAPATATPGDPQNPPVEPPWPDVSYGPLDLGAIFPDPAADPHDPAAYEFAAADPMLAGAGVQAECPPFAMAAKGQRGESPQALMRLRLGVGGSDELWSAVARRVVMHYNAELGMGIRYWEIEPPAGGGAASTALAAALAALQAYDPGLRVGIGGDPPALAAPLSALAKQGLRPALACWVVDSDTASGALAAAEARYESLLARNGLGGTPVLALLPPGTQDGVRLVCLAAGAGDQQGTHLAHWLCQGAAEDASQRALWEIIFAPGRSRLSVHGGDALGFAVVASKSADGRQVDILIADSGSRSQAYRLALVGLSGYHYTVRELRAGQPWQVIAQGAERDLTDGLLTNPWRSPAVQWIALRWDS